MIGGTLNKYKANYQERLLAYIEKYEDNTESLFLDREANNYIEFYDSLVKISDYFKDKTSNDLKINREIENVISDLKKISKPIFCQIFKITKTKMVTDTLKSDNEFEGLIVLGYLPAKIELNFEVLDNQITSAKRILNFINEKQLNTDFSSENESYKDTVWFKVGVLFASGELEKYYTIISQHKIVFKDGYSARKIAEELGNKGYNKVILASFNNYGPNNPNANKNIFNSRDKMLKIISHCEQDNLLVIPYFKERLPSI